MVTGTEATLTYKLFFCKLGKDAHQEKRRRECTNPRDATAISSASGASKGIGTIPRFGRRGDVGSAHPAPLDGNHEVFLVK